MIFSLSSSNQAAMIRKVTMSLRAAAPATQLALHADSLMPQVEILQVLISVLPVQIVSMC